MAGGNLKTTLEKKSKGYSLPMHGVRLPSFSIDIEDKRAIGASEDCSNYDFLRTLSAKTFKEKIAPNLNKKEAQEYKDRAKYELETLKDLDFIDYILLVWYVCRYCDKNKIEKGLGRGSAAGSLILYLIGVTGIDPIKHGLFFERFVSKVRAKKEVHDGVVYLDGSLMADIDLDICYYDRQKVLDHLEEKFKGKTSKILTLNTLSSKLLIKECGKITGHSSKGDIGIPLTEAEMNKVSAMIPKIYGNVTDIQEAYSEVPEFKEWCDEHEEVYKIALKLRNLIKNKSVHPSAIALSYSDLEDSCPTELCSDKVSTVSSYDMNWMQLFNVKLDVLGLRCVSVVSKVCERIGVKKEDLIPYVNGEHKDSYDKIYAHLQQLRSKHGLFQIEADTGFKVCKSIKPKNLEQLSAVLAIARPGALQFEQTYADWANGGEYQAIHPFFDDILSATGGVALYQEQLMKMAHKVGFTLDEAEILRRIVGKKKVSEVRKWKKKIKDKVKENNLDPKISDILWQILEDSANYSFNKSHSIAYAALSAITVYLKFNYPKEFFLELLRMTKHEPDPTEEISYIQKELYSFGIKLLRPHIVKSKDDFFIEDNNIRFGLLSIKGISEKSIDKIKKFRPEKEYSNKFEIFQAAEEAGLNIGTLSALIQAGALEGGYNQSRSKVVLESQLWKILTPREKQRCLVLAEEKDNDLINIINSLKTPSGEGEKPFIKESRYGTIKRKYVPYVQIYKQNSKYENFANWYYENKLLGYTHGQSLKSIFQDEIPNLIYVSDLEDEPDNARVKLMAYVGKKSWTGTSKNGNNYYKCNILDETGSYQAMIFDTKNRKLLSQCRDANGALPKEGNIVFVAGARKDGVIFADKITIQDLKIYTKLSELKE